MNLVPQPMGLLGVPPAEDGGRESPRQRRDPSQGRKVAVSWDLVS